MQFTTTYTLDECQKYLVGHVYEMPVLASTEVEVDKSRYDSYEFSVQRVWKGMNGAWRYTVWEAQGSLKRTDDQKTRVTAHMRLHSMGFVTIAFIILLFGYGVAGGNSSALVWVLGFLLLVLFVVDIYVLWRIVGELRE